MPWFGRYGRVSRSRFSRAVGGDLWRDAGGKWGRTRAFMAYFGKGGDRLRKR